MTQERVPASQRPPGQQLRKGECHALHRRGLPRTLLGADQGDRSEQCGHRQSSLGAVVSSVRRVGGKDWRGVCR